MSDNSKGELIKKQTSSPPKKKLVIKKVKKVVIKKQTPEEPKRETRDNGGEKRERPVQNTSYQQRSNNNDNRQGNTRPGHDNNNQSKAGKKVYYKKPLNNNQKPGDNKKGKPFNKPAPGNASGGATPVVQPGEKDRTRKKVTKKHDDFNKKETKREEITKAFNYRKQKEKNLLSSVPDSIDIIDVISISDIAKKMNLKANVIISKLMELGTMVTINDKIDAETAEILCAEYNCKVNVVSLYDETVIEEEKLDEKTFEKRPPIVTVMGHVDHGKTKLLDAIRSTDVVAGESGGITQHIGAYSVRLPSGEKITFIDTPGHQAFTTMRARGANVTDIVILVIAADDGVMPQTIEAINHSKAANVPIIVAINKIDKPEANVDRVKQQLSEYDLLPEDWGGQTLYCEISALKREGIDDLLDTVILQSEILELKAPYKARAKGFVLESQIEAGRGVVATVLIASGTLKVGDFFVAGVYSGKVRALYNDRGERIKKAPPSSPVEITGLEKSPKAGDPFNVTENEKIARSISTKRLELNRMEEAKSIKKITLKDLLSQKGNVDQQDLKIVLKGDVQGSVEALKDSLEKMSNQEVKITTVSQGVGAINESDVMLAVASNALIIGFHVRANPKAQELADKEKIEIKRYNIIYDVIEDIKAAMTGMIKPDLIEEMIGVAEVKQVFKISKVGTVAGCLVTSGKVRRDALIRLLRDDVEIYSGKISTLKRYKDDASEVNEGMECGIGIENYKDFKENDILEAYIIKEIARTLDDVKG